MEQEPDRKVCGAKTRQGTQCQKPPMDGKKRCKLHGGATPKGGMGRPKHGLYNRRLTGDEAEAWDTIPIGNIDDDIRIAKLILARAVNLHYDLTLTPDEAVNMASFEWTEEKWSEKDGRAVITKRPDTVGIIDRYLQRVANLEKTRAELIAAQAAVEAGEGEPLPWVD